MPTVNIPAIFWDDYCDRHSPQDVTDTKRGNVYSVTMTEERMKDILSDALHYAEGWADEAPRSIVLSARATVKRLTA